MAIDLHDKCRDRLQESLAEALGKIHVEHGAFIDVTTWNDLDKLDAILPSSGTAADALQSMIGSTPISTFLKAELWRDLKESRTYDSEAPSVELSDIEGYGDLKEVAGNLLSRLLTLPWRYQLVVKTSMPTDTFSLPPVSRLEISDDLALRLVDEEFRTELPFGDATEIRLGTLGSPWEHETEWKSDCYYYCQTVSGYIPELTETRTLEGLSFKLKAFFGLGVAVGLLQPEYGYYSPLSPEEVFAFVDGVGGRGRREPSQRLTADTSRFLRTLRVTGIAKKPVTQTLILNWIRSAMGETASGSRLQLAANWYFDSFSVQNDLLAFVQATVCSEILLGYDKTGADYSELGLTELLANRCAYLIASSHDQRTKTIKDFRRIYKTRSEIVHQGKQRLSEKERGDLGLLRSLCAQVMYRECELLV